MSPIHPIRLIGPIRPMLGTCPGRGRGAGLTIVELTVALGVLAVTVGGLIELQVRVNAGQEELWNRQQALRTAQNIAERVAQEQGDWAQVCAECDAMPGVDVVVEDGDGNPGSGWARISVHVRVPADAGSDAKEATLVFGVKK